MASILAQTSSEFGNSVLNGAPRSNDGSNHASDEHYNTLRDSARSAQSKHAQFAAEASKAYNSGNKAEASELSQKSKKYAAEADRLNEEAASWVFRANNTDSAADEIDLHGLYVKEALIALDARLEVCRQHNQPLLKAIVGKGLHSETHIAKLRPAVMEHCNKQQIPNEVDKHNPGVVLIHVSNAGGAGPSNYSQYNAGGYSNQPGYSQQPPQGQQQPVQQGLGIVQQLFRLLQQCLC